MKPAALREALALVVDADAPFVAQLPSRLPHSGVHLPQEGPAERSRFLLPRPGTTTSGRSSGKSAQVLLEFCQLATRDSLLTFPLRGLLGFFECLLFV